MYGLTSAVRGAELVMARLTSVFAVAVLRETRVAISTTRIVGDPEGGACRPGHRREQDRQQFLGIVRSSA